MPHLSPFTVIMPLHNEEAMIPLTFPSIYALDPSEVLLLFDRCSDHSIPLAKKTVEELNGEHLTRFLEVNHATPDWKFRSAYLRRKAYEESENDIILNTSADLLLDHKIKEYLRLMRKYKLISFGYFDYPWTIQCFIRFVISELSPLKGFAGLLSLSRRAWIETEDIEDLKKQPRAEDTHLRLAIEKKYPHLHINTRSLHLRPSESKQDHYNRGQAQWMMLHKPWPSTLAHSLVMLRPAVLCGYRHARKRRMIA